MRCHHCSNTYQLTITATLDQETRHFCNDGCLAAHERTRNIPHIQSYISTLELKKLNMLELPKTKFVLNNIKYYNLELLFYQGCLHRQTKPQLRLIVQALASHVQNMCQEKYEKSYDTFLLNLDTELKRDMDKYLHSIQLFGV
jgi:hypothetical protein